MSTKGVVSYLCDPDQGLVATAAWVADMKALGAQAARVPIPADARNHLPLDLQVRALAPYTRAGLPVAGVIDFAFNRPWLEGVPARVMYPNEPLGYQGNPRWNRFIKDSCRRAHDAAKVLAPAGMTTFFIGNEPDLQASIAPGANVPPVQGDKAPAMAPEVFYSYAFEVGRWLLAGGAQSVYLGSLSWLSASGDDHANPYDAGYMAKGLAYLASTKPGLWPWSAVGVNCEGHWTLAKAQAMAGAIAADLAPYKVSLPLVVGEWAWQNGQGVDPAAATETYQALGSVAREMYFFEYPARVPLVSTDYGARLWEVTDGGFVPAFAPLSWYPILRSLFAAPAAM